MAENNVRSCRTSPSNALICLTRVASFGPLALRCVATTISRCFGAAGAVGAIGSSGTMTWTTLSRVPPSCPVSGSPDTPSGPVSMLGPVTAAPATPKLEDGACHAASLPSSLYWPALPTKNQSIRERSITERANEGEREPMLEKENQ